MASGYYFPNDTLNYEMSFPGQMIYTFTVVPSVGIDARYSLVTTRWNPLTTDLSASKAQTDLIRGSTFNNAKAANQLIVPEQKPIPPTHVIVDGQEKVLGVVIEPKPGGIQEPKELPLNKYPS